MRATFRLVTFGGIGDCILVTPAIRRIRQLHPHARIVVYGWTRNHREVLRQNPHIDRLLVWRKVFKLYFGCLSRLTGKRFCLFSPYFKFAQPNFVYDGHASDIIADMFGLKLDERSPEIFLTAEEEKRGRQRLQNVPGPRIAFSTSTVSSVNKNWYGHAWEELVAMHPDWRFVQLGGPKETPIKGSIRMFGLPLRESFAVLRACDAFVGLDSGLSHAAAALHVPAVGLFGPSSPRFIGHKNQIPLYAGLPCAPCLTILKGEACPFDRACMKAITVDEVSRALVKIIAPSSAPR